MTANRMSMHFLANMYHGVIVFILILPVVYSEDCRQRIPWSRDLLETIKGYPDNYQQLLNAFYPINRAKPSSVIIAYFTNYTDPLPQECEQGTYPWKTYPALNYVNHHIMWYLWTTTPINTIVSSLFLQDFGEYLPAESYFLAFNKSSIFSQPIQIACVKVPLLPRLYDFKYVDKQLSSLLEDVTARVSCLAYAHQNNFLCGEINT